MTHSIQQTHSLSNIWNISLNVRTLSSERLLAKLKYETWTIDQALAKIDSPTLLASCRIHSECRKRHTRDTWSIHGRNQSFKPDLSRQGQAKEFGIGFMDFGLLLWTKDDSTQGYQLDHSLSFRLLKHFFDDVLLEHVGLIRVLPLAVHLLSR